jgi:hypothetical protein
MAAYTSGIINRGGVNAQNAFRKSFVCWHSSGASLVATRCSVKGFFTHVDNQSPIKRQMLGFSAPPTSISGVLISRDEAWKSTTTRRM